MSEWGKLPMSPGFFLSKTLTGTEPGFNYADWSKTPAEEVPLTALLETDCPNCSHPPTKLNEAQDRCARDGRMTCYRCGWKGPA